MNSHQSSDTGPLEGGPDRPTPREMLWLWQQYGLVLFAALMILHRMLWLPHVAAAEPSSSFGRPLGLFGAIVASLFLAGGIALLAALAVLHRRRFRLVFRWSRAHIIGAAALAFLTPFAVYDHVPFVLGFTVLFLAPGILTLNASVLIGMVAIGAAGFAFNFPISCLLVSGLQNRVRRLSSFCIVWFAAYGCHLLIFGNRHFAL